MVSDEFLQFWISYLDFPTLFQKSSGLFHQSYLTFGVQLNFVGCPLDFIPKCGAHTRVRGTVYELRPSPSFLIQPSGMVHDIKWQWVGHEEVQAGLIVTPVPIEQAKALQSQGSVSKTAGEESDDGEDDEPTQKKRRKKGDGAADIFTVFKPVNSDNLVEGCVCQSEEKEQSD
ncbi:hypothetical protein EDD22DRAFT_852358 [Suillus occidentalis]|nr:hypothetical protein EDD22DRAFT_852358 [Suillus occidentalis]